MISEFELIKQLHEANHNFIRKGHHLIRIPSKDELQDEIELSLQDDQPVHTDIDNIIDQINSELIENNNGTKEFDFIFTGNIRNASHVECTKWFLDFLSKRCNKITKYFFNKKLSILRGIIDLFLSVFSIKQTNPVKYMLQHLLIEYQDPSKSNIQSNLIWFDHTLTSRGGQDCSSFKIFYIVAFGLENRVIHSTTNSIIEKQYVTPDLLQNAKTDLKNATKLLKLINFTDLEIDNVLEMIIALIELSQYRAQGSGKKLEFIGTSHLNKAAENFLVKEKQLKDFLVTEYLWIDNKKKLKSPENVNYEIDSFISALYDVLLNRIFGQYNRFVEMESENEKMLIIRFINTPAIPELEKDKTYYYGHFYQYYLSSIFETASADVINKEVATLEKFGTSQRALRKIIEFKKKPSKSTDFHRIFDLILEYKKSNNRLDYLKKLEKKDLKTITFIKIDQQIYVDIFIPEAFSFIRFDWRSFIEESEIQSTKNINNFLKLTSVSLLQNYKVKNFSGRIWNHEDLAWIFRDKFVFNRNTFFVHSLVEESCQSVGRVSLETQINAENLQHMEIEELTFETIPFEEFVKKYGVLFLNFDDNSRNGRDAAFHAIHRLKLTDAWCCDNHIHLRSDQIIEIELQISNYHRCVLKLQGYARIIIAKIKLRDLRIMAFQYQEEYLEAMFTSVNVLKLFESEYIPIVNVDRENIDLSVMTRLIPDQEYIEKLKSSEKNDVCWFKVTVMSKTLILHEKAFAGSKICLYHSNDPSQENHDHCFDIGRCVPVQLLSELKNVFAIKISLESQSDDVLLDVKTNKRLYAWNVETEINKINRQHLPISRGYLYSMNQYRIFSGEYFVRKMAYNTLNGISYSSFQDLAQECSLAIILQPDPINDKILTKSILWILVTNCLPLINLQSTHTFNLVEKERRKMDKEECSQYVNGMWIRPKNDWLIPNVSTQLQVMSMENDHDLDLQRISSNTEYAARLSQSMINMNKKNYKTQKYFNKK